MTQTGKAPWATTESYCSLRRSDFPPWDAGRHALRQRAAAEPSGEGRHQSTKIVITPVWALIPMDLNFARALRKHFQGTKKGDLTLVGSGGENLCRL